MAELRDLYDINSNKTDKTYQELLNSTLNIAIRDYKDRVNKTHTFDTNILANFQNNGGLKGSKGEQE